MLALFAKVADDSNPERTRSGDESAQQSHNPLVVELLQDLTITTLRVLDAIGRLEPVNGITISEQFQNPKGTVYKITRRLLAKHLISTESLPQNKKEILFV